MPISVLSKISGFLDILFYIKFHPVPKFFLILIFDPVSQNKCLGANPVNIVCVHFFCVLHLLTCNLKRNSLSVMAPTTDHKSDYCPPPQKKIHMYDCKFFSAIFCSILYILEKNVKQRRKGAMYYSV